jgi:hypothetical protein
MQGDWYLKAQIDAFRKAWRGAQVDDVPGKQMRAALTGLDADQPLLDAIAYVQTLR